jgi:hypothetical protein
MAATGDGDSTRDSGADCGVPGAEGCAGERGPRPIREGAVEAGLRVAARWLLPSLLLAGCAAAPPPASSAWVLWVFTSKIGADAKDATWLSTGGYESHDGCATVADFGNAELRRRSAENEKVPFRCLPDAVDPRGPKGK